MKRFLAFVICAVVLVCAISVFSGCDNGDSSTEASTTATTTAVKNTTTQNVTTTTLPITSCDGSLHSTTEGTLPSGEITTTTKKTSTTTSKTTTTTTKKTTTDDSEPTTKYMQVIVGDSAWEQVMLYQVLELSGSYSGVYDWFVDGNYIHMTTYSYNRYLVMDMNTGKLVRKVALPDIPRKMQRVGDEVWIAFDALKTIKIYDFNTGAFKRDLVLEHKVNNFEVCGDYLFYSEDSVIPRRFYRYNLKTAEVSTTWIEIGGTMHLFEANTRNNLIYISGKGTTGCYLYALDMDTLEVKAKFPNRMSPSGGLFYRDGVLYWAGKKLNPTTLGILLEYESVSGTGKCTGMTCAENGFVIANGGLYRNNVAVRLCKMPDGSAHILDDGRIIVCRSITDSNGDSHIQFHIGFNIYV
ncbi:MAG: hypothetical protein IKU25_00820 [Clostridia bacterium]|nr:hypothetical protein [Clostridia bacterium]